MRATTRTAHKSRLSLSLMTSYAGLLGAAFPRRGRACSASAYTYSHWY